MVVLGGASLGHLVVGDIRNLAKQCGEFLLSLVHEFLQVLVLLLEVGHLQFDLFGFVALALLHEHAYLSGQLLGLLFCLVELALSFAATFVDCHYLFNGFASPIEVLFLKATDDPFCFLTDEF